MSLVRLRRGLAVDWAEVNPILTPGEPGVEVDSHRIKVGDGVTRWNALPYVDAHDDTILATESAARIAGDALLIPLTQKGAANGVAPLDSGGLLSATLLGNFAGAAHTWTALQTFGAATAASVGMIVKGVASQSADLQQWQGSTGSVLTYVRQDGALLSTNLPGSYLFYTGGGAANVLTPTGASGIPLVVKGWASQSANLQEWQDSAGGVYTYISSQGNVITTKLGANFVGSKSGNNIIELEPTSTISSRFTAPAADRVPVVIKSAASQSADLFQTQGSAGGLLTTIGASGLLTVNASGIALGQGQAFYNASAFGDQMYWSATGPVFRTATTTNIPLTVRGAASQSANIQEWQTSAGTAMSSIGSGGGVFNTGAVVLTRAADATNRISFQGNGNAVTQIGYDNTGSISGVRVPDSSNPFTFSAMTASTVPLVSKGFASQSADLQQWQDSTGAVKVRISASGAIGYSSGALLIPSYDTSGYGIHTQGDANKGLVIRANSGTQSANLFEAQNSAGNAKVYIDGLGDTNVTRSLRVGTVANPGAGLFVTPPSTSSWGLILRGLASQSADYLLVQTSTAATLAKIDSLGVLTASGVTVTAGGLSSSQYFTDVSNTVGYFQMGGNPSIRAFNRVAGNTVFAIVGAASQTATLQEWQDSTGAVLARVTSTGVIGTSQYAWATAGFYGGNGAIFASGAGVSKFLSTATTDVPLAAQGVASQSADLQQWQDSTGTALMKVNNLGRPMTSYLLGFTSTSSYMVLDQPGIRVESNSNPTQVLFALRGAASQSGDLMQFQSSTAAVLTEVYPSGAIRISPNSGSDSALYAIGKSSSSAPTIVSRGGASQTGSLQEWQDSSGAALLKITPAGNVIGLGLSMGTGALVSPADGQIHMGSTNPQLYWDRVGGAGSAGDWLMYTAASTTMYLRDVVNGRMAQQWTAAAAGSAGTVLFGNTEFRPESAGQTPLVVKGFASQTAAIQVWRDSSNVLIASVGADGLGTFAGVSALGNATNLGLYVSQSSSSTVVAQIKGAASQSADLMRWTDSVNGVLASITAGGAFKGLITDNPSLSGNVYLNATGATSSPTFYVRATAAANVAVVVKGFASQSANLQEWQNSAGTLLARFGPFGNFVVGSDGSYDTSTAWDIEARYAANTNSSDAYPAIRAVNPQAYSSGVNVRAVLGTVADTVDARWMAEKTDSYAGLTISVFPTGNNYPIRFQSGVVDVLKLQGGASNIHVVVKADASQSGDLLQLQDSSAAVLGGFNATGKLGVNGNAPNSSYGIIMTGTLRMSSVNVIDMSGGGTWQGSGDLTVRATGDKSLLIRGDTSQSFPLVSFQNVGQSQLAKVAYDGGFYAPYFQHVSSGSYVLYTGGSPENVLNSGSSGHIVVAVRGAASQSSDLQQWQDSASAILARITATGTLVFGATNDINTTIQNVGGSVQIGHGITIGDRSIKGSAGGTLLIGGSSTGSATDGVAIDGNNSTYVSSVLTGSFSMFRVSQAVNPNAATTTLSPTAILINPTINYGSGGTGTYTALKIAVTETALPTGPNYLINALAGSGGVTQAFSVDNKGATSVVLGSASSIGLVVKAAASQSASLTEWQDSTSAVLAKIDSIGRLTVQGVTLVDGYNVILATGTGTKVGTATSQKLGFWNATPVVQQARPTDVAGVITLLTTLGLCA